MPESVVNHAERDLPQWAATPPDRKPAGQLSREPRVVANRAQHRQTDPARNLLATGPTTARPAQHPCYLLPAPARSVRVDRCEHPARARELTQCTTDHEQEVVA